MQQNATTVLAAFQRADLYRANLVPLADLYRELPGLTATTILALRDRGILTLSYQEGRFQVSQERLATLILDPLTGRYFGYASIRS